MKLRTRNGVRKYKCKSCQWEQEEAGILDKAIEQTKMVLKGMLNEIVMQIDMSNILQKRNEFISRVNILFCEFEKVEAGDKQELIRILRNYVPFELGKQILVYRDRVEVNGMVVEEVMQELDISTPAWLKYAYVGV